jgi:hypothetical protein
MRRCALAGTSTSCELATKGTELLASLTMFLLAALLCNYGRGKCLIDIGTEGTHSAWAREAVAGCGHEVLVANPRQMEGPKRRKRKNDRIDAHKLARVGRMDPQSLFPVDHRRVEVRQDLVVIRARDALMAVRTELINTTRRREECEEVSKKLLSLASDAPRWAQKAYRTGARRRALLEERRHETERDSGGFRVRHHAVRSCRALAALGRGTLTPWGASPAANGKVNAVSAAKLDRSRPIFGSQLLSIFRELLAGRP